MSNTLHHSYTSPPCWFITGAVLQSNNPWQSSVCVRGRGWGQLNQQDLTTPLLCGSLHTHTRTHARTHTHTHTHTHTSLFIYNRDYSTENRNPAWPLSTPAGGAPSEAALLCVAVMQHSPLSPVALNADGVKHGESEQRQTEQPLGGVCSDLAGASAQRLLHVLPAPSRQIPSSCSTAPERRQLLFSFTAWSYQAPAGGGSLTEQRLNHFEASQLSPLPVSLTLSHSLTCSLLRGLSTVLSSAPGEDDWTAAAVWNSAAAASEQKMLDILLPSIPPSHLLWPWHRPECGAALASQCSSEEAL